MVDPLQEDIKIVSKVPSGLMFGLALSAAAVGSMVLFRLLNRVKVEGVENIPEQAENVLYCLNHNSILDNFAFESAVYFPKMVFKPEYLPINLADRKNFFGDPDSKRLKDRILRVLGRHFFRHLRAFPVDRKRGDLSQVDTWIEMLKNNIVVVFPEGTRSRSGEIGHGKAGVGKLIYEARPTVIPVRMVGMSRVLGVGRVIPGAFQTVRIFIEKPLDMSRFIDRPRPPVHEEELDLYKEIAEHVIAAIKSIAPEIPEPAPPPPKSFAGTY
jgi:1-acyl-sn-glycerol-3-phosphate acyltransferase